MSGKQLHYGTISRWFTNRRAGAITTEYNGTCSVILSAAELPEDYQHPQVGDTVRFAIGRDKHERLYALSVEPVWDEEAKDLRVGRRIIIRLHEWDMRQNGGYGLYGPMPVFVLGQFLNSQLRIPEPGEPLRGTLMEYKPGSWLLRDVDILEEADIADKPETAAEAPTEEAPEVAPADVSAAEPGEPPDADAAAQPQQNTGVAAEPSSSDGPFAEAPAEIEEQEEVLLNIHAEPIDIAKALPKEKAPPPLPANTVLHGSVAFWDDDKGYGFIQAGAKRRDVFFHVSAYHYRKRRPQIGDKVSFFCDRPVAKERQKAVKVVLSEHEHTLASDETHDQNQMSLNVPKFLAYSLISGVYLAVLWVMLPKLAWVYGALSLVALMLYAADKSAALANASGKRRQRTAENTLHLFSMCGGWPGALVARSLFNHKTTKAGFVRVFWLTVVANMLLTAALLTYGGNHPLVQWLH